MSYRLVDLKGHLSPCPSEVWQTRESAEQGLIFWELESGMKLKIVGTASNPNFPSPPSERSARSRREIA